MNLFEQLTNQLNLQSKHVATIVGSRGRGLWVARTMGGAVVLLTSPMDLKTNDKVYYDRISMQVLGMAPDVAFAQFGV